MRPAAFLRTLPIVVLALFAAPPALADDKAAAPELTLPYVPKIVLYTMGRGELIFEKWGHAALCVERPGPSPRGICYNYGTTDFANPVNVVWDFVRGKGRFWVARDRASQMIRRYQAYDRSVWRQVLPLDPERAMAAARRLEHEALPENRYYIYHHFFDNCTTRVRDIIDDVVGGALKRDTGDKPGPTFRDYSREGFAEMPWALVGTDYLLARQADEQPDIWQAMFLPDYLREHVANRLGVEAELIYERRGRAFSADPGTGGLGWLFLLALVLAALVAWARWQGRFERASIAIAVTPLFLISIVVWGLPVISSIEALRYNEVLLVYFPVDVALLFLNRERRQRYARLRVVWLVAISLLRAIGVFTQPLWGPIALAIAPLLVLAAPVFPNTKKATSAIETAADTAKSRAKSASKGGTNTSHRSKKRNKKKKRRR